MPHPLGMRGLAAALLVLGPAVAAGAAGSPAGTEHWQAMSTTAMGVTGNVTFAPDRLTFQNGRSLRLAKLGEVAAFGGMEGPVAAVLYRVIAPADLVLSNGNHLCGGGAHGLAVTFIAVWTPKPLPGDAAERAMAAFSGTETPRSARSPTSCGIYNYTMAG